MEATDEGAALDAISYLHAKSTAKEECQARVKELLTSDEPFADINELFDLYDVLYFRGQLSTRVEVSWSTRMTLTAGICELLKDDEGKYRRIRVKLSEPLLKFRPREDTVNTLLHEFVLLLLALHSY